MFQGPLRVLHMPSGVHIRQERTQLPKSLKVDAVFSERTVVILVVMVQCLAWVVGIVEKGELW